WPRDTASPEPARRAVRSCALFATARWRSLPAKTARPPRYRPVGASAGCRRGCGAFPLRTSAPRCAPARRARRPSAGARHRSPRHSLRLRPGPLRNWAIAKSYLAPVRWRGRVAFRRVSTLRPRRTTLPSLAEIPRCRPKRLGDRRETEYRPTLGCRSRLLRGWTEQAQETQRIGAVDPLSEHALPIRRRRGHVRQAARPRGLSRAPKM